MDNLSVNKYSMAGVVSGSVGQWMLTGKTLLEGERGLGLVVFFC